MNSAEHIVEIENGCSSSPRLLYLFDEIKVRFQVKFYSSSTIILYFEILSKFLSISPLHPFYQASHQTNKNLKLSLPNFVFKKDCNCKIVSINVERAWREIGTNFNIDAQVRDKLLRQGEVEKL